MIKSFGLIAAGAALLATLTIPFAGVPTIATASTGTASAAASPAGSASAGSPRGAQAQPSRTAHTAHAARTARAARTLDITDRANMHYTGGSGSLLHESGAVAGMLPGSMKADCEIGATLSTSFTIYAAGGTIKGHGTATPHGSGVYESFAGTLVVTGGSGRYAHAHGDGQLYGVFDRRNYALTVQTTGKLSY